MRCQSGVGNDERRVRMLFDARDRRLQCLGIERGEVLFEHDERAYTRFEAGAAPAPGRCALLDGKVPR
jgi:hypothetical protein